MNCTSAPLRKMTPVHPRMMVEMVIVRMASPVISFRRTATADTELGGRPIAEGDKVVMWYNSANRDERAFADPWRFDVLRDPNPQVSFGSGGPHFCLGANLARREITMAFAELHRQVPDLETAVMIKTTTKARPMSPKVITAA